MTLDNNTIQFSLIIADSLQVKQVNAFYKAQQYKGKVRRNDQLAMLHRHHGLLGVARLTTHDGAGLMRNLCVQNPHQRQGVGSLLLHHLRAHYHCDLYAFPLGHLLSFYQRNRWFQHTKLDAVPVEIRAMYLAYQGKYPDLKVVQQGKIDDDNYPLAT